LLNHRKGVTGYGGAVVCVVFVDKRESAVGLNAIGEVGVAAGDQDQVALELAFGIDGAVR